MDITEEEKVDTILEQIGLSGGPFVGPDAERAHELLLPLLQEVQDQFGYLPRTVLDLISRRTGVAVAKMFGIATFYSLFHLQPTGEHTIRCCQGTACHIKGAKAVADTISKELSVADGGTTSDGRFTYESVQCLGTCFLAPVVMVDDDYHGEMSQDSVKKVLKRYS